MSTLHFKLSFFIFLISFYSVDAQWDQYEAVWKGKPGSMMVNMDLKSKAPLTELPFIIEVTEEGVDCNSQGYLSKEHQISFENRIHRLDSAISEITLIEEVGRFLYQCTIKDYFYVRDTSKVSERLSELGCSDYKIYADINWKIYLDFICPDAFLEQTMLNRKVINQLHKEGVRHDKKVELRHYASFETDEDRGKYRSYLNDQNFTIIDLDKSDSKLLPYQIIFMRRDQVKLQQLSNITLRLHQKCEFLNGRYEGWGIELE